MNFEFNPFELNPAGAAAIKSITLFSNIDWFAVPDASIAGENVALPINTKTNLPAYKVFATGSSNSGAPSMQSLVAAHIPPIQISQVIGLTDQLGSLVHSIASGNATALSVTHNAQGDYMITPNFGNVVNKIAQGNDTRFSATLSAGVLRKTGSGGVGSADVAATAKTDYWDTTDFGASGGSHARGLVPDPGASAGTTKFLCEDKIWKVPPGSGTVTNISTTSPITGGTISSTGTIGFLNSVDLGLQVPQSISKTDATTNGSGSAILVLGHHCTATPVTNFGAHIEYRLDDDTNPNISAALVVARWTDAAHATHTSDLEISTSTGGALPRVAAIISGAGGLSVGPATAIQSPAGIINAATGFRVNNAPLSLSHLNNTVKVDYWNADVFVGTGPSNAKGLVPAPGTGSSTTRYLNETGVWMDVAAATGTVTNASLATMLAKTLKANATSLSDHPQDVSPQVAKSSALLNLESIVAIGDTNVTMTNAYRIAATSASLTANRTWTLPLANSVNAGYVLTVSDNFGGVGPIGNILVSRQGSDLIQGSGNPFKIDAKYGQASFVSDGVNKWSVTQVSPPVKIIVLLSGTTYIPNTGVKALYVEVVGGGGGGGGAKASAGTATAGGGGGGGSWAAVFLETVKSSYTYTIGALGAGGAATGANGTVGGNTTFDSPSVVTGIGGGLGGGSAVGGTVAAFPSVGGAGGAAGGIGDMSGGGGNGDSAMVLNASLAKSGQGGMSLWCGNSYSVYNNNGAAANGLGGGGSGASSISATGFSGGNGYQGGIRITEYY